MGFWFISCIGHGKTAKKKCLLEVFFDGWEAYEPLAIPSKIEWDLSNGPLSKLLELLNTQV